MTSSHLLPRDDNWVFEDILQNGRLLSLAVSLFAFGLLVLVFLVFVVGGVLVLAAVAMFLGMTAVVSRFLLPG